LATRSCSGTSDGVRDDGVTGSALPNMSPTCPH
jgi:hypothetical protein